MRSFAIESGRQEVSIKQGFRQANIVQLCSHILLAVFIGVTLRLTTFTEATTISEALGGEYQVKTSFLVSFGFTKAFSNLIVGRFSDVQGRKLPHMLGWIVGVVLGVLLIIMENVATKVPTNSSGHNNYELMVWYTLANVCLGAQQGWTWTTNIFMMMDILGPNHRALASSLSNSLGYLSAACTTYAAASFTATTSFQLVLGFCVAGLIITSGLVRDTSPFVTQEVQDNSMSTCASSNTTRSSSDEPWDDECDNEPEDKANHPIHDDHREGPTMPRRHNAGYDLVQCEPPTQQSPLTGADERDKIRPSSFATIVAVTCWYNKSAAILCVGGLLANTITSLAWGLVLIWGKQQGLSKIALANIGAVFTFAKGFVMVLSGYVSDKTRNRKGILLIGFTTAFLGLLVTAVADWSTDLDFLFLFLLFGGILIGSGVGSVYCVMTAALSDHIPPQDRASAIGVYKFWRDSGYAMGGLLTGFVADASGGSFAVTTLSVAVLVGILVIGIALLYQEIDLPRDASISPRQLETDHEMDLRFTDNANNSF